jgi:hypothetical protein
LRESEKSLNQDSWDVVLRIISWGRPGLPCRTSVKVSNSQIIDTSLGKPKAFQVEEDKILAEVTLSTIYRRMPLIWKGVEEGS